MPSLPPSAEPSSPTEQRIRPFAAIANQYARDVVDGRQLACKWIKLQSERHLEHLDRSLRDPKYPYVFDETKMARFCRFFESMPHVEGEWAERADSRIHMEPWQCWAYGAPFGWVHRATGLRRYRIVYNCVPRKNAKSTAAAVVGNYMTAADGEYGAQVYTGATCRRQAMYVFRPAKLMLERSPRLRAAFGIEPKTSRIIVPANGSYFEPLTGKPGDGANPHCSVIDEFHEHRTAELFDAMRTGMGARRQPFLWVITTAGSNTGGPCYLLQKELEQVLEGKIERDNTWVVIFTLDDEDDWTTEEALIKSNPNYDVSVSAEFLRSEQQAAIQSAEKQNVFKNKNLNLWTGSGSSWLNMRKWQELGDPRLSPEQFAGEPCWAGCDLSTNIDPTAKLLCFKRLIDGVEHYYLFGRYYLPLERILDKGTQAYQKWLHEGYLTGIPGPTIQLSVVREDLLADSRKYDLREVAFDPHLAIDLQRDLALKLGQDKIITIPQRTQFLSYPMLRFEALILEKRIHHDANPVLTWMLGNIVVKPDLNDNLFPRKEKADNKIDGGVAALMAHSRAELAPPLIEAGIL